MGVIGFFCAADPQFQSDLHDAWHLLRNMFDANGLNLTFGGSVQSLDQFCQAQFAVAVGLDHHADDGIQNHLISGLNTTGSLIPITFSTTFNQGSTTWNSNLLKMCGGNYRPTVFVNLTSTLLIYQNREISVVN